MKRIRFVRQTTNGAAHIFGANPVRPYFDSDTGQAVPEVSFDMGAIGRVIATITGRACKTLVEHCGESNLHGREVGGLLVGYKSLRKSPAVGLRSREYDLIVTDSVPVQTFDSSSVHINFTAGALRQAEEAIRVRHMPDGKINLGWYHTHPDQGIFFSAKDQTAHGIFQEPYQIAMVVDPRDMDAGIFYWTANPDRQIAGPVYCSLAERRR
jgi:proteasome lid subunit RPN8/RPN11